MRSLIDHGRFCWYHALNDRVQSTHGVSLNLLELARIRSPDVVKQVGCMAYSKVDGT